MKPPQSCPTRRTRSSSSASSSAMTSPASSSFAYEERGASDQPKPRRSGHSTRCSPASRGMTRRQQYQCCGQPCSSTTGSPAPASATCRRTAPACTKRCSTPGTLGISRPATGASSVVGATAGRKVAHTVEERRRGSGGEPRQRRVPDVRMRPGRRDLLERLDPRAQLAQLVGVDDLPHVGEHLALLVLDVMADLGHQRGELVVEGRIVGVELLQPLQRLLRCGVLLARVLGLLRADLAVDLGVDEDLLGHRVTDELDRHLLGHGLAPLLRLVGRRAAEGLELREHLLDLAMIVLEHLDHVALLVSHSVPPLVSIAAAPPYPVRHGRYAN